MERACDHARSKIAEAVGVKAAWLMFGDRLTPWKLKRGNRQRMVRLDEALRQNYAPDPLLDLITKCPMASLRSSYNGIPPSALLRSMPQ